MSVGFAIGLFMIISSMFTACVPIVDEYYIKISSHEFNMWVYEHSGALLIIFLAGIALMIIGG